MNDKRIVLSASKYRQMKELRIVFMGTPEFAVESLKALTDQNYNIVGVVTVPDKPAGRGQKLTESPVKQFAVQRGIKVLQPFKLKDPEFISELESLQADLQVIVAFRMLPEVVWNMPPLGSFNLHASLLPQYRGAAPINWAVINGETQTGVTTFFLKHEIDTGGIIFQEKVEILPEDTAGTVHDKLMHLGATLVVKTVEAIAQGEVHTTEQEHLSGSEPLKPAPKLFKEDGKLVWTEPAATILNKIRGLSPYPAAWTELVNDEGQLQSIKVYNAQLLPASALSPGETKTDGKHYFHIGTPDGTIAITDLQLAGKKRMPVTDFLKGFRPGTNLKAC